MNAHSLRLRPFLLSALIKPIEITLVITLLYGQLLAIRSGGA